MYCIFNGEIIADGLISIPAENPALRYGMGFFETMRWQKGTVPLFNLHRHRVERSLEFFSATKAALPFFLNLQQQIQQLATLNNIQQVGRVRLTILLNENGKPFDYLCTMLPLGTETFSIASRSKKTGIYVQDGKFAGALSPFKHNNYFLFKWAQKHALDNGYSEMIILNQYGRVAECSIANVLILENGCLITPPANEGPVRGVMLEALKTMCATLPYPIREEAITVERLEQAEEILFTNALKGICWAEAINAIPKASRVAKNLMEFVEEAVFNNK